MPNQEEHKEPRPDAPHNPNVIPQGDNSSDGMSSISSKDGMPSVSSDYAYRAIRRNQDTEMVYFASILQSTRQVSNMAAYIAL